MSVRWLLLEHAHGRARTVGTLPVAVGREDAVRRAKAFHRSNGGRLSVVDVNMPREIATVWTSWARDPKRGASWRREKGSSVQAPILWWGDYVIVDRGKYFNLLYRPQGQHHFLGEFSSLAVAKKAAEGHSHSQRDLHGRGKRCACKHPRKHRAARDDWRMQLPGGMEYTAEEAARVRASYERARRAREERGKSAGTWQAPKGRRDPRSRRDSWKILPKAALRKLPKRVHSFLDEFDFRKKGNIIEAWYGGQLLSIWSGGYWRQP